MNAVFADSFFFIAILNPRDECHHCAAKAARELVGQLISTEWVLVEVADAMAGPAFRNKFVKLVDSLRANANAVILPATSDDFEEGLSLYRSRNDKRWSLTDCLSFVVMKSRGITEALTADHHFEQAGFVASLKDR